MSKDAIEAKLVAELGMPEVIWLPHGLSLDEDTDGHVDNVAIFIAPGVMVMQGCADRSLVDHERLIENRRVAERFDVTIREIPVLPTITYHGATVQVPYLNFYLVNGGAIVPVCGHPDDDEMLALLADFMPDQRLWDSTSAASSPMAAVEFTASRSKFQPSESFQTGASIVRNGVCC